MAKCPKCGRKLTLLDWRPNCPGCGVNIVYYNLDERLQDEADVAEAEHARLQKRIDRLKASFIGSKLTIARIFLSILPIATLLLPLANVNLINLYGKPIYVDPNGDAKADAEARKQLQASLEDIDKRIVDEYNKVYWHGLWRRKQK